MKYEGTMEFAGRNIRYEVTEVGDVYRTVRLCVRIPGTPIMATGTQLYDVLSIMKTELRYLLQEKMEIPKTVQKLTFWQWLGCWRAG